MHYVARVQRVHEPVDLLHPQILRLLVLLKPADFEAQSSLLKNRLHEQIQCNVVLLAGLLCRKLLQICISDFKNVKSAMNLKLHKCA